MRGKQDSFVIHTLEMMKLRSFKYQVCRTRRSSQLFRHQFPWFFISSLVVLGWFNSSCGDLRKSEGEFTASHFLWAARWSPGCELYSLAIYCKEESLSGGQAHCFIQNIVEHVGGRNHARHFTTEAQSVQCRIECIAQDHLGVNVTAHTEQCDLCSWMHMYEHQWMDGGGDSPTPLHLH